MGFPRDMGHKVPHLAGRQGFEPRLSGPEPLVLPLDDRPSLSGLFYLKSPLHAKISSQTP